MVQKLLSLPEGAINYPDLMIAMSLMVAGLTPLIIDFVPITSLDLILSYLGS